jgi:uncharacterized protein
MATTYKTPGVYVEEIPKFPPSVAQVETAIPAFIGYTEKAEKNGESLFNKAKTVDSLAEFESYYGAGPQTKYETHLDATDAVEKVVATLPYCMYESLRMFYDNGGGKVYIIAVGAYNTLGTVNATDFTNALKVLEKEDEPTIIVCPDATKCDDTTLGLYDFQKQALAQCAKLGDRFLLCDTYPSDENTAGKTFDDRIQAFRDNIGISNLKYGAAYAPYLNSSLPKTIKYRDIILKRSGGTITLESLTSNNDLIQLIYDLKNAKKAVDDLKAIIGTTGTGILTGTNKSFEDQYKLLFDEYATAGTDALKTTKLKALYAFNLKVMASLYTIVNALPAKVLSTPVPASPTQSVSFLLKNDLEGIVSTVTAKTAFETLGKHSNAYAEATPANELMADDPAAANDLNKTILALGITPADYNALTQADVVSQYAGKTAAEKNEAGKKAIAAGYTTMLKLYYAVQTAAAAYEKTFDDSLEAAMGTYKQIKAKIAISSSTLPPSGTIAGIYARVDNSRGVWKAPANESINSVYGPLIQVSAEEQTSLNVDPVAGKSINIIRTFTGKGTLVWGARTLAGNDNEWRYVSVRRFFNMVEESSKKASESFVFEANDANTWVKVQGMLENFLTILWRQGALQGAKPEHAFYVAVGLGKTMTALDILEGRMIVEIGMAVVRPAEFIILRFSHKMAES